MTAPWRKCETCKWWQQPLYLAEDQDKKRHCKRRSPEYRRLLMALDDKNQPINPDWDLTAVWPSTRNSDSCGDWEELL